MVGVASSRGAPQRILDHFNVSFHSPQVVLKHFGEHFVKVLGGQGDISLSDLLDTLVCEVEYSLGAEGEVCDEPFFQEMAECITTLRNAGLKPATWLHKAILVVWHSDRAFEAWKNALVVPLYKGKGSHQCMDNY
jgi:hypothetical protein